MELTLGQQIYFDTFDIHLSFKKSFLLPSDGRRFGETTVINEIGFLYQALGYEVLLFTENILTEEMFATKYISDVKDLFGIKLDNCIAVFDGYNLTPDYEKNEIIQRLECLKIPYVGFARLYI